MRVCLREENGRYRKAESGKKEYFRRKTSVQKQAVSTIEKWKRKPVSTSVSCCMNWAEASFEAIWHQYRLWLLSFNSFLEIVSYSIDAARGYLMFRAQEWRVQDVPSLHFCPWRRASVDLQINQRRGSTIVMQYLIVFPEGEKPMRCTNLFLYLRESCAQKMERYRAVQGAKKMKKGKS